MGKMTALHGRDEGHEDSVQIGKVDSGEAAVQVGRDVGNIQGDAVDVQVDMEEGCEDEGDKEEGEEVMDESEVPMLSSGCRLGRGKDL
ncbi:hypothetical protein M9H77_34665 [Catharanthus roseus]|uniref:Uncharacterized protein n=1 Tax=Catharanthus roseus TaxID=4058 RepID=A0ACB9ZMK6_CATRO|nr:hypothetical protein M9H77_34665 [Catharanthus roseus]